jgi:hypothetical protein
MAFVAIDVAQTLELTIKIAESIKNAIKSLNLSRNLDRKLIIRSLLRHCRADYPDYNVAIFEPDISFYPNLKDKIFEEQFELQDLVRKFKFKIVLFKAGTISLLHGLNNAKRWGIFGNIDKDKTEFIEATNQNIYVFDEPQPNVKYNILPDSN